MPSSWSSARVMSPARSEPPLGSERNWQSTCSPRIAAATWVRFCSSLPMSRRVAAQMANVGMFSRTGIS